MRYDVTWRAGLRTLSPTQPECGIGRRAVPVLASIAALTADDSTDMQWSRVAQARECAGMCSLLRLGSYLTSHLPSPADSSKTRTLKSDREMAGVGRRFLSALPIQLRNGRAERK